MKRYTQAPYSIANLIFDVAEGMIFIRFLFVFFAANRTNAFVGFFIKATQPLVAPFVGIFQSSTAGGLTLEWASVIAMAVYALAFALILRLIHALVDPVDAANEREEAHHSSH